MFFDDLAQLPKIAEQTSCAIFVTPPNYHPQFQNALFLAPDTSKKTELISVEQMREFLEHTTNRETSHRYFVIQPAEAMNEPAQNAFLKSLEEPHDFCHFILLTTTPNLLLPTILSRTQVFVYRTPHSLDQAPTFSAPVLETAKALIAATSNTLPDLAEKIAKSKPSPRQFALDTTAAAIELIYRSYFKTKNPKFLAKLPNFLTLHQNLTQNGHIKLQIVANLC